MIDKSTMNAKQFLKGFDEELQNLIEIESFYTDNGRDECVKFFICGKEFKAKYWNTFAYFYGERPRGYKNYLLSYSLKEVDTKDGSMCIGFDKETFVDCKITMKLMKSYFEELR